MAAKTRRKYEGNAVSTTISSNLGNGVGDTSISITAATGWPSSGPFYVVVDPGNASEEKMLVGTISGTALSSITRGVDGTSRVAHSSGATIYPVFTAVDADEANELTSKYTTRGDLVYQGASTFETLAKGTANHVLKQGANDPAWGYVTNDNVDASAAIVDTKLATVSTANKVALSALDIDGGTDIGADLADADLVIVDDGAGGTNRKSAVSRFAKYLFGKVSGEVTVTEAGVATTTSGMVKVASGTFDTASAVFEVTGFSSTYTYYKIVFSGTRSTSGAAVLDGRLYNGASGLTGMYAGNGYSDYTGGQGNAGATNNGDNFYAGTLHSSYRGMTAIECRYKSGEQFTYTIAGLDANNFRGFFGGGFRNSTTAWDRIRFTPQAGNITGEWALYGYRP